jgi:hypothetical protein
MVAPAPQGEPLFTAGDIAVAVVSGVIVSIVTPIVWRALFGRGMP